MESGTWIVQAKCSSVDIGKTKSWTPAMKAKMPARSRKPRTAGSVRRPCPRGDVMLRKVGSHGPSPLRVRTVTLRQLSGTDHVHTDSVAGGVGQRWGCRGRKCTPPSEAAVPWALTVGSIPETPGRFSASLRREQICRKGLAMLRRLVLLSGLLLCAPAGAGLPPMIRRSRSPSRRPWPSMLRPGCR